MVLSLFGYNDICKLSFLLKVINESKCDVVFE